MKSRKPEAELSFDEKLKQAQDEMAFINAVSHFTPKGKDKNELYEAFKGKKGELRQHFAKDHGISNNSLQTGTLMFAGGIYGSLLTILAATDGGAGAMTAVVSLFGAMIASGAALTGISMKRKTDIRKQIEHTVSEHKRLPGPKQP